MKTLYVTDLDGTLLDNDSRVSKRSAAMLCQAIEKGASFQRGNGTYTGHCLNVDGGNSHAIAGNCYDRCVDVVARQYAILF